MRFRGVGGAASAGYRRRYTGDDGAQQAVPGREQVVGGDQADMLKQAGAGAEAVEGDQHAGQGFLAVAEIVLQVIAAGLEDVEGFVLDLSPGAAAGGEFGDVVAVHRQVRDEAGTVGDLAVGFGDLDPQPVDGLLSFRLRALFIPSEPLAVVGRGDPAAEILHAIICHGWPRNGHRRHRRRRDG